MLTKNLAKPDLDRHLEFSGLILRDGRADGSLHIDATLAPTCSSIGGRTSAALRHALGPRVIPCTPEMGTHISAGGGYNSYKGHSALPIAALAENRVHPLLAWWGLLTATEDTAPYHPQAVAVKR